MAFLPIDLNTIKVGDPITRDLWLLLKNNMDDHEVRINSLATSGGSIHIFNGDVSLVGFKITEPDIFYYKSPQEFSVSDFRVQLFSKQGLASGNLVIDLQKSIDTDDSNFSSILQTSLSFDFASDADYSQKVALIDSGVNTIPVDSVLRVKITNIPSSFDGKILIKIGGQ